MSTKKQIRLLDKDILLKALKESLVKLNPLTLYKNPVIFIVGIGAFVTTFIVLADCFGKGFSLFDFQLAVWLWFTVLFSNFSEAIAEGRGKAQAESLRKGRSENTARLLKNGSETVVAASSLKLGDVVVCETGDIVPSDGEVIEGIASVDESAITGESAPVIRESGGDRSAVTGGTCVISDRVLIRITAEPGNTFIDKMISLVEGAQRQKTPNEIALGNLLTGLTIIFIFAVATLPAFFSYALKASALPSTLNLTLPVLTALLVCLIPTTIGGLLSAIGISGMDRLLQRNVIATSGKAIEAAGDVDVLLLDKTGTITHGNRMASIFVPLTGISKRDLAAAALLSSLADETPEGRSIVQLAIQQYDIPSTEGENFQMEFIPFTAQSRMSGVNIATPDNGCIQIRKGSAEAIKNLVSSQNHPFPEEAIQLVEHLAKQGSTPLVVCKDSIVLGVIDLKDIVKDGIRTRFDELRKMGIRTIMITGDNNLTAAAIAQEAGVDGFMAEAKPEDKLARIRQEQAEGRLVGMIGDGTNDAPALAQADVGIAMSSGTQAAREAGNMVDLDNNPTKLIEVVEVGKQLLMTRGALTTFSIANDVAKYFAILPAISIALYAGKNGTGPLASLNIMHLGSPESAILSAVIFNALIIVLLIPLALKGVRYKAVSASKSLTSNLLIYGLGGLAAPFIGIKLIDILLNL